MSARTRAASESVVSTGGRVAMRSNHFVIQVVLTGEYFRPFLPCVLHQAAKTGRPPSTAFHARQPIRYSHCDSSGIVYFPRFFDLFNNVLEDWFAQELGCPWSGDFMGPRNLRIPTVGIGCQFARGCHLGDMLEFELWLTKIGRSSMQVALSGSVGGEECMRVAWTLCVVSSKMFKSVPIPDDLRARMEPFLIRDA